MPMHCAESTRVHAYFDGEVDAAGVREVEAHLAQCAGCRALLGELGEMRSALRDRLPDLAAPPQLRQRIGRALDLEGRRPAGRAWGIFWQAPAAASPPRRWWRALPSWSWHRRRPTR